MSMIVRPYIAEDGEPLAELLRRSVSVIGPRDYSSDQVQAWLERLPDGAALHARLKGERDVFVAVDEVGKHLGLCNLEADGHIDFLYCAPEVVGKGVGSALYDALEQRAVEHGLKGLYVEASEAARRLFLRKGFVELHRRDFTIADVAIHNYAMEKLLS